MNESSSISSTLLQRDINISMQGAGKLQYFASGAIGYKMPHGLSMETQRAWKQEYELCDCSKCYDSACKCRDNSTRFPVDAGGECQCLRLAQAISRYAFRNENGTVIIIPDSIIESIRQTIDN